MNDERRRRRLRPWLVVLGLLAALLAYMYWPMGPVKIIISRQTTYIDGPLNADGTVNYVAYLDANYAKGVTPENNAAPLLLRAMGAMMLPSGGFRDLPPEKASEVLRRLSLPASTLQQDKHFIAWGDRARPDRAEGNNANSAQSAQPNESGDADNDRGPRLYDVEKMILAGKVHPDLEPWLARNASPLELIREASTRQRYYMPLICWTTPPSIQDLYEPPFRGFWEAEASFTIRARLKVNHNDLRGAWDDLFVVHHLSRLMAQGPTINEQLCAVGSEEQAAKAGIFLATRGHMPVVKMRELLDKLSNLEPVGRVEEVDDKYSRFAMLDAVGIWARGQELRILRNDPDREVSLPDPSTLDYNQMLRDMNGWYDRLGEELRLARKADPSETLRISGMEAYKFLRGHSPPGKLGVFVYNHGGRPFLYARTKWVTGALLFAIGSYREITWDLVDLARMSHEIETLAVSLACFHAESGRWPTELKELCPSLLKTIPIDRFSGKPLIYRPSKDGYLLYSIGRNRKDDGGQNPPNDARKDDIVAEVKPAEAASKPVDTKPADAKPAETASRPPRSLL